MDIEWLAGMGRAILFLGIPFVVLVFYSQYRWSKTCDENILVLVAEQGGGSNKVLAKKEGGVVTITNPDDDTARSWPVNELATIDMTYPGVGFLPSWMQKKIKMAIFNEGDWEPMLNRSPHRERIASPDVVDFLREIAENGDEETKARVEAVVGELATGPTREMIADPAHLGNLMRSTVLKAVATVSNDLIDVVKSLNSRLGRVAGVNPTVMYLGMGLVVVLLVVLVVRQFNAPDVPNMSELARDVDLIKQSLGIVQ